MGCHLGPLEGNVSTVMVNAVKAYSHILPWLGTKSCNFLYVPMDLAA